jgi:hypothetical protein
MAGSVTSVITTGPDGAPLDDGSQQSTLSNASAGNNYYNLHLREHICEISVP